MFVSLLPVFPLPLASVLLVGGGLGLVALSFAGAFVWAFLELRKTQERQSKRDNAARALRERVSQLEAEKLSLDGRLLEVESEAAQQRQEADQAVRQADEAKDTAERASRAKGTFLATMSHEIRTPLNCIRGLSEVLMATDPTDEQKQHLHTIRRSVDALLAIVGNILDFSKIESGNLELRPERFNLNELIEEIRSLFDVDAKRRLLDLQVQMEPDTPFQIITDRSHLRQVLINLVANGLKYTEKGSVSLVCTRSRIVDDTIPPNKTYYQLSFRVTDTGVGIPADKRDRLFQPFNQLVESKTRKYEGTGLGLAICHRIVTEGMRGEISVADNPGGGSVFEVLIPVEGFSTVKRADEKKLTNPQLIKHALGSTFYSHKILVADDNHLNCEVMRAMLKKMGHEADFVYNGRDAVDYLANNPADVVLMDIMMPLMDGLEATQRIRAGDAGADKKGIPIIALTAFAMTSDREEILAKGFDYYLSKPIEPEALRETLTGLARGKTSNKAPIATA
ncbi:MAG: ATP-binding protein [Opitutales bacterium]